MHLTDEPSPHNVPQATPILRSFHPLPPVNVGNSQVVLTSPVPTIAIATESPANTPSILSVAYSESDARPTLQPRMTIATHYMNLNICIEAASTIDRA
jgi:hypothetical protein